MGEGCENKSVKIDYETKTPHRVLYYLFVNGILIKKKIGGETMIDLFQMLGIEYREDKYTYCLLKMIECGDDAFRKKVGQYFGFSDEGYSFVRRTF